MQGKKTGVINDTFMLKHKTKKVHPQKPKRVEQIMQRLHKTGILEHPHIDFISEYDQLVTDDEIMSVHSKKYVDYFNNIWPKQTHRHDLTVIDTYFCQHSNKAARMSAGGVLLGVDKIMNGQWKNGFAVVRPPGHHAGIRNILNGFCLLNNVAIGARYVQKKFGVKKVAILDWDIHRGDGTHHIFEQDRDVLFISIHRYDHGIYYPSGEQGNFDNCGKGEAEGTKVNIPLNHYDQNYTPYTCQAAGDNQYIYLYHRIVEPILKQFNPQFLFISSGFDASRFDPLGDFTVTPNGYYYMARKIAESGIPVLGVLEGGYNPQQLALDVDAVIHGLISQGDIPEPIEKVSFDSMKDFCQLAQEYHKDIDKIIQFHSKHWKSLQNDDLVKYTQRIKANKERIFGLINQEDDNYESSSEEEETKAEAQKIHKKQVGQAKKKKNEQEDQKQNKNEQMAQLLMKANNKVESSHQDHHGSDSEESNQFCFACGHMQRFKNFNINNQKAMKWAYPEQHNFYQKQYPEAEFAPKYFGVDEKYIILENVLYKLEDHVVADFKIGRFSKKPGLSSKRLEKQIKKENASTTSKYAFRLSGFTTPTYKEGGILVSDENVLRKLFEKLVTAQNKTYFCDFLQRLADTLKKTNRRYYNTSIFITKSKNKSVIKWIDFHYWEDNCNGYDEDSVQGIENIRKFIDQVNFSGAPV